MPTFCNPGFMRVRDGPYNPAGPSHLLSPKRNATDHRFLGSRLRYWLYRSSSAHNWSGHQGLYSTIRVSYVPFLRVLCAQTRSEIHAEALEQKRCLRTDPYALVLNNC